MQMDQGLDTGPILLRRAIDIGPRRPRAGLHDRLASLGAELIVEALEGLAAGRFQPTPQPAEGASYAAKLTREEERLRLAGASRTPRPPGPGLWPRPAPGAKSPASG